MKHHRIPKEQVPKAQEKEGVVKYALRLVVWLMVGHTWKFWLMLVTAIIAVLLYLGAAFINTPWFTYRKTPRNLPVIKVKNP